ncbi:TetR/AcrR family transcriptional regulator [Paenibacillus sp. GSMTC-2017]|uniref:TetR/AcrR family transcriptional regulator n=1 Tax=Paenibacillus sp. GSMTC-2017 TaxID=2794350 RepID=UPI0018D70054|nr:TetR/AcrR family transcriptional regulator [Paenibacillus sp. GSMTC-2017]MBH5319698.1 TetR/AcrR family transcriptional regulator [Paenibacillus sp. GSMTC-2017]
MNGYERRKQGKMEQIFHAAFELFNNYGFQKVSVNEIAQEARVSPMTIYNYFGTKEQLYIEMLINWMDKQLEQYETILQSDQPFPDKTKEIMLGEIRSLNIMADEFLRSSATELSELMVTMERYSEDKVMPFFMRFVALGKQEGYIHAHLTDEMAIIYFTMFKNELSRNWEASQTEASTHHVDQWIDLFFNGLSRSTVSKQ